MKTLNDNFTALSDRVAAIEDQGSPDDAQSEDSPSDNAEDMRNNLQAIHNDELLNRRVQQRLWDLHLLDNDDDDDHSPSRAQGRKKSGRVRTTNDLVQKDVEWPHFHVYRGSNRALAKYDELTVQEIVMGYTSIPKNVDSKLAKTMVGHLHEFLMTDDLEYSWPAVQNYHAILLQ